MPKEGKGPACLPAEMLDTCARRSIDGVWGVLGPLHILWKVLHVSVHVYMEKFHRSCRISKGFALQQKARLKPWKRGAFGTDMCGEDAWLEGQAHSAALPAAGPTPQAGVFPVSLAGGARTGTLA